MWSVRFVGLRRELGRCFTLVSRTALQPFLIISWKSRQARIRRSVFSSTRTSGSILKADQYILPIDQQFTESLVLISFCLK